MIAPILPQSCVFVILRQTFQNKTEKRAEFDDSTGYSRDLALELWQCRTALK
jgi:hypothetical protein